MLYKIINNNSISAGLILLTPTVYDYIVKQIPSYTPGKCCFVGFVHVC